MKDKLKSLEYRFQALDEFYGNTEDMRSYEWLVIHNFWDEAKNKAKALLLELSILVKEQNITKEEFDSVKDKFQGLDFFYEDCYELLIKECK